MDIRDYEKILDAISAVGIYVVREDNHEILYCNNRMREMIPAVDGRGICDGMWANSCAGCPLLTIGDRQENRSICYDSGHGTAADLVAKRILWEGDIPAIVVTVSPHMDDTSYFYRKILRVNLSCNSYELVKPGVRDGAARSEPDKFSDWPKYFTENGTIHPEDTERFLSFTHLEYLKSALRTGRKTLTCSYRRSSPDGYRWNMLEVIPDTGYTDQNQTVLIYIKDIHDMIRESLELDETSVQLQEIARILGEQNVGIYAIDLSAGKVNLIRENGDIRKGWTSQTLMWDVVMQSRLAGQIHPENKEKFTEKFSLEGLRQARDAGLQKTDMLCRWDSGGRYRYRAVIAYFGRNQGTRDYAVLAIQDVDERVTQEQILSRRDMQMAAILKSRFSVMTTVYLDSDWCERVWLNESSEPQNEGDGRYTDYYRRAADSFIRPEDVEQYEKIMSPEHMREQAANTEDYSEEVFQYRPKRATVQWLESHVIYIRRNGQVVVNILGRDITKEKLEEEKQLRKEREQRGIINSLSSMFFATYYGDLEQNIFRSVNQLEDVEKVLGSQSEYTDALRAYAENFVHPEDRAEYLHTMSIRNLQQVLCQEHPFVTFAYRKQPKNRDVDADDYGWIRATAVMAQTDENGRAKGIVYAAQDVTESKLKEMREQKALQAACEAANHANASKSEFLSRMSHDIRTPMNGIIGMTRIAADNVEDTSRVKDCLGKITVSGNRLLSLINEILDMSEMETGNVDLVADEFGLSELVNGVAEAILPDVEAKGLGLEIHPVQAAPENQNVIGDKARLHQAFLNILENSVKFTPKGGLLELSVAEHETKKYGCCAYDFVFRDNGIGMEEDFLSRIFEPFSRAEDSRTSKVVGAGLGMTITQNIVRMMGGHIEVKSKPGQGTQVTVTLPLKLQNAAQQEGDMPCETPPDVSADMPFVGRRVLLVEDNEINQEIAMEIIGATGAAVECAADGRVALEWFEAMPEGYYDMIFMDIQMPVMNGYDATRAIRLLPRGDALSIPIIALSANSLAEDIAASREAGMNEHMAKPLEPSRLLTEMGRWLDDFHPHQESYTDEFKKGGSK